MHPFEAKNPHQLVVQLGYLGLVPFVSGALGVWVIPLGWRSFVISALLDYSAVLLAFLGAIHWGLAMRAGETDARARMQLGLSVIPAMLGWVAVASGLPVGLALPIFLLAFVMLYFADLWAVRLGLAPRWYPALRKPLTIAAAVCLLLAWASLLLPEAVAD